LLKQNYEQTEFLLEVAYENHKVPVNQFVLPEKCPAVTQTASYREWNMPEIRITVLMECFYCIFQSI
jgi:hypothetical protein